jgi:cephalosporin-C deacetylase
MGVAVISVDCREQGGATGNCAKYSHGAVTNVVCKGALDKNEYYYRAVYMDCLRALDVAEAVREIDASRLIIEGGSQGGALALAICGLDSRPALCMADVPSNCNIQARIEGRHGSYSSLFDYIKRFPDRADAVYATVSYFDVMNLAERIACPVFASTALRDETCPARCFYAAYNRITTAKEVKVYPFNGHEGGGSLHTERKLEYLARFLSLPM